MLGFAPIAGAPLGDYGAKEAQVIALTVDAGSFATTAHDASLKKDLRIDAQSGAFTLSLQSAAQQITDVVSEGQFNLTGNAINFGRSIFADAGAFVATGQDVSLTKDLRIEAQSRLFTLSLQGAAKLITEFVPDGQFSVTGQEVSIKRSIVTNAGSFALTGQDAFRNIARPSGSGDFTISQEEINFGFSTAALAGSFSLVGQDAFKQIKGTFGSGDFAVSQEEINFGFSFTASAGSFAVTGQEITEDISESIDSGAFTLALQDATLTAQRNLSAISGLFSLSVYDVGIKGFLSPASLSVVYTEQTVPEKIWTVQTEPTDIWVEQVDASSPTYTEASDTSVSTWTEAA